MKNVVFISMDEVRPDRLGCYGYNRNITKNIDIISNDSVVFENCYANSNLTPISHGCMLTGFYPKTSGMRDPFCLVKAKLISEILKENGYLTTGFVGNDLIGVKHGFGKGFDYFNGPTEDTAWENFSFSSYDPEDDEKFLFGNLWTEKMIKWIKGNKNNAFFAFGHFYHCHEGGEIPLIKSGIIDKERYPEFSHYDAKIEFMDKSLFGSLLAVLKELDIYDNTIIIITSDHGTTLGEHPVPAPLPHRKGKDYPQHRSLYDVDLKVPLIIRDPDLQSMKIKNLCRSIDIVPTLVDLLGLTCKTGFDGESLITDIKNKQKNERFSYAEAFYDKRPPGSMQSMRTSKCKCIRNVTKNIYEFYDIVKDPGELKNIINDLTKKQMRDLDKAKKFFKENEPKEGELKNAKFNKNKNKYIMNTLKNLGYI